MTRHRTRRLAVAVALVLAAVATGCGRDEFEDRTARVTIDGASTTYQVDSCGRDDRTVFVVGRAEDGSVLQEVVGLQTDRTTPILRATGLAISPDTADGDVLAAFGPIAWTAREEAGAPPGEIRSARLRGSRIQVTARAERTDPRTGATGDPTVEIEIDARCDLDEG